MLRFRDNRSSGFSLVELMTATAVATMLMLILAGVSTNVSRLLTVGLSQNQNRNTARIAMNYMAREMKMAAISQRKDYTVSSTQVSRLHFVINPSTLDSSYCNPDSVFWQAPISTATQSGDIAEVGYFVWRREITDGPGGKNVFHSDLCRFYIDQTSSNFKVYSDPGNWVTTTLVSSFIPTKNNNYSGLFLENVIGLWVIPYKADGSIMNTPSGTAMTTDHTYDSRTNNVSSSPTDRLPPMVQVSLLTLDDSSLKKLNSYLTVSNYQTAQECLTALRSAAGSGTAQQRILAAADAIYFNVYLDNYNP